jgi:hypothetical protein
MFNSNFKESRNKTIWTSLEQTSVLVDELWVFSIFRCYFLDLINLLCLTPLSAIFQLYHGHVIF